MKSTCALVLILILIGCSAGSNAPILDLTELSGAEGSGPTTKGEEGGDPADDEEGPEPNGQDAFSGTGIEFTSCGGFIDHTSTPGIGTWPDTNQHFFFAPYAASPVHETIIEGKVPNTRWWSLSILNATRNEVDTIVDREVQLLPDGESYRVHIRLDCAGGPANCLELGKSNVPVPYLALYRIYVPDDDGDPATWDVGRTGGVPIPTVQHRSLNSEGEIIELPLPETFCQDLMGNIINQFDVGAPEGADDAEGGLFSLIAKDSGLDRPVCEPGEPPEITRARGTGAAQVDMLEEVGVPSEVVDVLHDTGGFGATRSNSYVSANYNLNNGNLLLEAMAPSYDKQHFKYDPSTGEQVYPLNMFWRFPDDLLCLAGADLDSCTAPDVRYWSICSTTGTRAIDCLRDENVILEPNGTFRVIISPSCPVPGVANCLRAGIASAAGGASGPLMLYRNSFANDTFFNERGPEIHPDGCEDEEAENNKMMFCGDYKLRASYVKRDCE